MHTIFQKQNIRIVAWLVAAFAVFVFFFAANPVYARGTNSPKRNAEHFGILVPNQREQHWVRLVDSLRSEALKQNKSIKIYFSDEDQLLQAEQLNDLYLLGTDLLFVAPVNEIVFGKLLQRENYTNLQVVSLETLILDSSNVEHFLNYDYQSIARTISEIILQKYPEKSISIFLHADDYETKFLEELEKNILISQTVFLDSNFHSIDSNEDVSVLLSRVQDKGIIISDSLDIIGELYTELQKQSKELFFIGLGTNKLSLTLFEQGVQILGFTMDEKELAKAIFQLAEQGKERKQISTAVTTDNGKNAIPTTLLSTELIDISNYQELLVEKTDVP